MCFEHKNLYHTNWMCSKYVKYVQYFLLIWNGVQIQSGMAKEHNQVTYTSNLYLITDLG